jgi:DNA-binding transcriptional LysR family regulator
LYLRDSSAHAWSFERTSGRKRGERVSVPVGGPLKANNSEVLREAVLDDLGIGLLPDFSALDDVQSGRLVLLLPDWTPVGFFGERLYAIRPWTPVVPRAVRCLVDYLRHSFGAGF